MYAITGTTGHLGQTILRQAKASGLSIRAVVRETSDTSIVEELCDETVTASLDDVESLTRAFRDCGVVIHAAAMIEIRRGYKEQMRQVNVQGTKNVMEACKLAGVGRLVHLSSIEAINMKKNLRPISEKHGFAEGNAIMDYGETKAEASRYLAAADKEGLETIIICPTSIMGPWDFKDGLTTTMFNRYLAGRIPASVPGGFDYVDVREVAGAVLAAASGMGCSGEAYLVSGNYMGVAEMFKAIEHVTGKRRFTPTLPVWLAEISGFVSEIWSRLSGRTTLFTLGSIKILQIDAKIDRSKAEKELGYVARPLEETIADMVAWLQGDKDLDPSPANAGFRRGNEAS